MSVDYQDKFGAIPIGAGWPEEGVFLVTPYLASGWAEEAESRTWRMRISAQREGGTPEIEIEATSAVRKADTDYIDVTIPAATPAQTAELEPGEQFVAIESVDAGGVIRRYSGLSGVVMAVRREGAG